MPWARLSITTAGVRAVLRGDMLIRRLWKKIGVMFDEQKPGVSSNGPIAMTLAAISRAGARGKSISQAGSELSEAIIDRGVWVLFAPTGGDGATPVKGLIVLDNGYRNLGQVSSVTKTSIVAHELVHVLQRDLADPKYWPSGLPRLIRNTRWIADSTNYMEVLAYIVGWIIEHDLESDRLSSPRLSTSTKKQIKKKLEDLENRLATLTGPDVHNAKRYIVWKYKDNFFYKQNYRKEVLTPCGRIPVGGWRKSLKEIGFKEPALRHIKDIASNGLVQQIDQATTDEIAGSSEKPEGRESIYLVVLGILGAISTFLRRIMNVVLGALASVSSLVGFVWLWWFGIGAAARGLSIAQRDGYQPHTLAKFNIIHWPSLLVVGIFSSLIVYILYDLPLAFGINMDAGFLHLNPTRWTNGVLPLLGFMTGYFHQLLLDASISILRSFSKRVLDIKQQFGQDFQRGLQGIGALIGGKDLTGTRD